MAASLAAKRMARERQNLEKPNPDYFVHFPSDNLFSFEAYIYGAPDSLYTHKLIKVHIDISPSYPIKPPTVKFIQRGRGRVHPNLYQDGKVCLSILGTWPGEPWAPGMTVHTVLITIRSLLDKQPFLHEPNQRDDPNYNAWVEYATWKLLLLDYLDAETDPALRALLHWHLVKNGNSIEMALRAQKSRYGAVRQVANRYDPAATLRVDYASIVEEITRRTGRAQFVLAELRGRGKALPYDVARAIDPLGEISGNQESSASHPKAPLPRQAPTGAAKSAIPSPLQTTAINTLSGSKKPEAQPPEKRKREADTTSADAGQQKKRRDKKRAFIDLT